MNRGFNFIFQVIVFTVVFSFVANLARVLLTTRVGIFPYQLYILGSIVLVVVAVLTGSYRLPKANVVLLVWLGSLLLIMCLSLGLIARDVQALATFKAIGYFIMMAGAFTLVLQNRAFHNASGYGVFAAVIVSATISYIEFLNPDFRILKDVLIVTDADRFGAQRISGLHGDPNANGTLMVLGMFVSMFFIPKYARFVFALLVGGAVFTTVSRGSLLLWALVVFACFWVGAFSKGRIVPKLIATGVIFFLAVMLTTGQVPAIISALNLDAYMNEGMIERLSSGFIGQDDNSTAARLLAVEENFTKFTDNPVLGAGLGVSGSDEFTVGSHNMLLRMASELGMIGVLVYVSLLIVPFLVNSRNGFLFVVFFYISNLFTHTSFQKPTFAMLVPLAIIAFAASPVLAKANRRRRRKRKSSSLKPGFYG